MENEERRHFHLPVLSNEAVDFLQVLPERWYVDATAGGGGYTEKILKRRGHVLAIDQDTDAIQALKNRFTKEKLQNKVQVVKGNFRQLKHIVKKAGISSIHGIVFDLGMSNFHLKGSGRGFSFLREEALDMRMDVENRLTASEVVNTFSEDDLYEIFRKLGEEELSRQIARAILVSRSVKEIKTSSELARLVSETYKKISL